MGVGSALSALGTVLHRRGLVGTCRSGWRHAVDGGGIRRFLLWCRDVAAYERRGELRRYQAWLARRQPVGRRGVGDSGPGDRLPPRQAGASPEPAGSSGSQPAPEFVCVCHPDAELSAASREVLIGAARRLGADVAYADEDQISDGGSRLRPRFKPGFSIDLLRSQDYIGPVYVARRELVRRAGCEADADSFETLLALYEHGAQFVRVPEVLLHWRRPRPWNLDGPARAAVSRHLRRCYGAELGAALDGPGSARHAFASRKLVSIIIPTRDRLDLLASCVGSIYASPASAGFEVLILDNGSRASETVEWLRRAPGEFTGLRVVDADFEFNWSRLNNLGIAESRGELLLFLNNDVDGFREGWLDELVVQACRLDVGAVGPLLLYPDGTIQHAGVVIGMGGFADHVYAAVPPETGGCGHLFVDPKVPRNVLACTGACLMIARDKLERVGGFNEQLKICGDIDVCLRLHEAGFVNLFDPRVVASHHESATRSRSPMAAAEIEATRRVLADWLTAGDPFYNPNFDLRLRYPTFGR